MIKVLQTPFIVKKANFYESITKLKTEQKVARSMSNAQFPGALARRRRAFQPTRARRRRRRQCQGRRLGQGHGTDWCRV